MCSAGEQRCCGILLKWIYAASDLSFSRVMGNQPTNLRKTNPN